MDNRKESFTLIELLIVVGMIGILSAVTVVIIQPNEMINRARDGKRVTDLKSINDALRLYQVGTSTSLGSASTTYISIPDTSSTCSNLILPSLPSGWQYRCVVEANLRDIDGNGWIPINLSSIASGPPFSKLPIDPTNSDSQGYYYTYVASWELTASLQAQRRDAAERDGGTLNSAFEIGTNLSLTPNR
jgi:type II secretory pathway pseudopilin PulG